VAKFKISVSKEQKKYSLVLSAWTENEARKKVHAERLLDFILIKIKNILEKAEAEDVDKEKKEKLQKLYNSITSLKKSTNVTKLREVWELGLKKIWEIELKILAKYNDDNSKKLLDETNSLLKKIGSKEQFYEKEKTLNFRVKSFFNDILTILKARKTGKLVSYTKLIKWYNVFVEGIIAFLQLINVYFIFIIYGFSLLFILYIFWIKIWVINFWLNISWIFTIIYVVIWSILIFLSRGLFSLSFNLALFTLLFILWVVNF